MPIASAEYIRLPIKIGDKGVAVPASFYLGGISGLGGGTATDALQGNLSTLFWVPIGSTGFFPVNPTVLTLYGPGGVTLQDITGATTSKLTPSSVTDSTPGTYSISAGTSLSLSAGGHTILINAAGITIDGIVFAIHGHSGVTAGTAVTGPVVP